METKPKVKVFMGILSTGDRLDVHTFLFRDLQERYGDCIEMVFPDASSRFFPHDFARNQFVEMFLQSDCDVLWFLDSDVVPPLFIFDLIKNQWNEWQVAGAPYPLWSTYPGTNQLGVLFTTYDGTDAETESGTKGIYVDACDKSGQKFVDALATGCLFIKREVFSKLEEPYFEFKFNPKTREVTEGEDLGFCLKLKKIGIKCLVDYGMVCQHLKRVDLLAVNNYAIEMANQKVMAYDKAVRGQVQAAITAARKQGFAEGLEAAKMELPPPSKSKVKAMKDFGLILPSHMK